MSETNSPAAAPTGEPAPAPARRPIDRRLAIAIAVFAAVALWSRFYELGRRPFHHDESLHAYMSYTLSKDGGWRYDPAYHGPFLYYANALVYKLFGASNVTARLLPAIFGLALIGAAWPLARWLGPQGAAGYALVMLLSPHMAYFSRFIREDMYSLVFTLGTILAFRMYLETDRPRWLILSAASFALAGTTKENAYMTGVLFVAFGLFTLLDSAWRRTPRVGAARENLAAAYAWVRARLVLIGAAALVFLFIWALLYTAFGRYPGDWLAIPKAVGYWIGQHTIARIPGPWWYYLPQLFQYDAAILLLAAFAFSAAQWKSDPLLRTLRLLLPAVALLALADIVLSYRVASPWKWIGGIALVSVVLGYRRIPTDTEPVPGFLRFWAFWTAASFFIYAWAREKVPWLTVHPLFPLTILAGLGAARLWSLRTDRKARIALAAATVLLACNAWALYLACFRYGAYDIEREPNHGEMLAYVQTTEDLVRALSVVDRARPRVTGGEAVVTVVGEASWPLTWYLRDVPTKWSGRLEEATTPVIVIDWDAEGTIEKQLKDRYDARRVPIRAWWFPTVVTSSGPGAVTRPTLSDLIKLFLFHQIWSPIGSQDATFLVRKDIGETGPLSPLSVRIQDTTSRDFPSAPDTIAPVRAFGQPGSGPGSFAEPRGLATDTAGNLYVADTKNHRIQVFDPSGKLLRSFGTKGPGDGQLNEPCGVAVDSTGEVWVADTWNGRIARFGPDGSWRGALIDPQKPFFGPRAVVISKGQIFVADTGNKRIARFEPDGRRISDWGTNGIGAGQFVEPVGLAADAAGNIWVADTGNHRIQIFEPGGKFVRQFPVYGWKDFYTEPYIALGAGGTVFATDSGTGRVALYDAQGNLKRTWKPNEPFKAPTGITLDPFGTLIVSDRGSDRIFAWSLSSVMK
jgi:uncharacterized protein (TIGR03663 family)